MSTAPELIRVTSHGHRADARLFVAARPRAALLWTPAMGVDARAYDRFATCLAREGITVLVNELRGGETSDVHPGPGVDFGYSELLADQDAHLDVLASRAPGLTPHFGGHSLGGQLAVLQLPRRGRADTRLVLVAAGTTHYTAWPFPWSLGVLLGSGAAGLLARTLGFFPGHRVGFGGRQPRTLIGEWALVGLTGHYRAHGRVNLEGSLEPLSPQVLAVHIERDLMSPPSSMKELLGKLPRARISHVEAPAPPEPRRVSPHFRWLRGPEPAAGHVARFLLG